MSRLTHEESPNHVLKAVTFPRHACLVFQSAQPSLQTFQVHIRVLHGQVCNINDSNS